MKIIQRTFIVSLVLASYNESLFVKSSSTPLVPGTASAMQSVPDVVHAVDASPDNSNPILKLGGYVKDSFVRFKDGTVQLYTNHQSCNEIRSKQRAYLSKMAASLPADEQKSASKYKISAGGISYEEFVFLQKGKEDRGKLANIVLMMMFTPNFVPYAFMFFPEMLPSPFSMSTHNKMGVAYSKWDNISRERTHAVVQAMLDLERSARIPPMISNLNPFKGGTKRMMEKMDKLGHQVGGILVANGAKGSEGAELVMEVLKDEIYKTTKHTKKETSLSSLPKAVITGLGRALEAPSFNSLIPNFVVRGKVLNSLKQIEVSDEFLAEQNIDLKTLSTTMLQDACHARLIGGIGRSDEEMIDGLSKWLDLAVKQPTRISKQGNLYYNSNLARAALLAYNAVDAARDERATSYLPRLLFQGQAFRDASKYTSTVKDEAVTAIEEGKWTRPK
jgi:hypothetical protein